jgi:uncharacterized protein (DUF934 family)
MALISKGEFVEDGWRRLADEEELPKSGHCVVSQARLGEALETLAPDAPLGVLVANTTDPETLEPHFARLALIAVAFPATGDGRGYSLARLIRRLGFTGELRASGKLIADQATHALRCGFDTIEIPTEIAKRQDAAQWKGASLAYDAFYQQGYANRAAILAERRKSTT